MNNLKQMFLYGSLDRNTYCCVRPRVSEENRRSVNVFTLIGAACFLLTAVMALLKNRDVPVSVYFIGIGAFLLMFFINRFGYRKAPLISDCFAVTYSVLLMAAGIFLAYSQCDERTTLLLPFYALISLVFCYRPIYLSAILLCTQVVYLYVLHGVQSADLFFINLVNTCIFCFVGMAGGFYTLIMKYKKYKAEYENQVLLEKDILTGLYNRYSWEIAFNKIAEDKKPVTVCSFDINGLKQVNDAKSHLAGDELIRGAADCIRDVFGEFGNIYRIGGDEFCALLFKPCDGDVLRKAFDERVKAWQGQLNDGLSIALGISECASDFDDLSYVVHQADQQMYDEKRSYYRLHDRRQKRDPDGTSD